MALGALLLLGELEVAAVTWGLAWPALLMLIGGWLLFSHFSGGRRSSTADERVNIFAIFGEAKSASGSTAFAGANVTAILGGTTLNLQDARLAPDGPEIAAAGIFGGAEVLVPPGWDVRVSSLPIFGGVDDQTRRDGAVEQGAPRLVVKGLALFGSVEVKSAESR